MLPLLVALTVGGLLLWLGLRQAVHWYYVRGKPPPQPPSHWLLGHFPLLAKGMSTGHHIDHMICQVMKTCGKFFELKLGLLDFCIVLDPELIREILLTKQYPKSYTYHGLEPLIGHQSMVLSPHHIWRKQRNAFNPGFAFQFLKNKIPIFMEKTEIFLKHLDTVAATGEVVKLHPMSQMLTLDIILQATLSQTLDVQSREATPELVSNFMKLVDITAYYYTQEPHMKWQLWLPWVAADLNRKQKRLDDELLALIDARMQQMKQQDGAAIHQDILSTAMHTAQADSDGPLDRQDILSQVKTLLFAGHDTTASIIALAVYELCRHPEAEAKVVDELRREWGGAAGGRLLDSNTLTSLKYLMAVVKETLRLWPPAATARQAPLGSTLQGYDIGRKVLYLPQLPMHRDPDLFGPDADEFRPERWLDEQYVNALHPLAFMPFSKGPRDCIGQTFALLEVRVVLAMVLDRFTFEYAHDAPERQADRITSHPKFGVRVKVHKRS